MLMPAMDGITTIRTIQKLNPQTKIIATSGLAAQDKFHGMTDIEVQAFLAKPYTAQELLQNDEASSVFATSWLLVVDE
ncbi:MAG: hypothetical protein CLLPBCKN_003826 [Chroococcidiopsis cubana SAG 39.79]|nr:hypothetical protein [Chroococcidiopsis cubana SAG 39.79]